MAIKQSIKKNNNPLTKGKATFDHACNYVIFRDAWLKLIAQPPTTVKRSVNG